MKTAVRGFLFALVCAVGLAGLALPARAETLAEVRARVAERLPDVVALLRAEKVGENNRGFLTVRERLNEAETRLVELENADRGTLYAQLASLEPGLTPEDVGRAQARQIARRAHGYWVEDEEGTWARRENPARRGQAPRP